MAKRNIDYNKIYAYTTEQAKHIDWIGNRTGKGLIKIGQTTQDTTTRIRQQFQGSPDVLCTDNFEILVDEEAININGEYFQDSDVFKWLKVMGVHRVPKTEWFEATLDEVREAIKLTVSAVSRRTYSYKRENTVENRGGRYNKEEAQREKTFIKNADRILNIMRLYEDATTLVKIGKRFCEHYGIKQYAPSTVANLIAPIIKKLKEIGVLENTGTLTTPKLVIIDLNKVKGIKTSSTFNKPAITLEDLKRLGKVFANGFTVKDIEAAYSISNKSYLYEILDHNFVKIKREKEVNFHGNVVKYILPEYVIKVTNTGKRTDTNISYSEEDVLRLKRGLKGLEHKIACSKLTKKTNLSLDKISVIIKERFPRLIVALDSSDTYCVYRKIQCKAIFPCQSPWSQTLLLSLGCSSMPFYLMEKW